MLERIFIRQREHLEGDARMSNSHGEFSGLQAPSGQKVDNWRVDIAHRFLFEAIIDTLLRGVV